jgi:prepilin-type N-terminal cleavage/methylation domain-containing protein
MSKRPSQKQTGFTIVELLIVIVVIAILATITVVAYNGVQDRARDSKISADLAVLDKAINAARVNTGNILMTITGSTATASNCMSKAAGTDLATLNKTTDTCWTIYALTMQRISDASGINVRNLTDPWGRPYAIDENEGAGSPCGNGMDNIGVYTRPLTGTWAYMSVRTIPYITPGC